MTAGTYYRAPRREGLRLLFIPLMVLTFIAGLVVGSMIEKDRPDTEGPNSVNVEGHEGEILVIGTDGQMRWTTEAGLHKAAGHG